jgi:hypothetical protein
MGAASRIFVCSVPEVDPALALLRTTWSTLTLILMGGFGDGNGGGTVSGCVVQGVAVVVLIVVVTVVVVTVVVVGAVVGHALNHVVTTK